VGEPTVYFLRLSHWAWRHFQDLIASHLPPGAHVNYVERDHGASHTVAVIFADGRAHAVPGPQPAEVAKNPELAASGIAQQFNVWLEAHEVAAGRA